MGGTQVEKNKLFYGDNLRAEAAQAGFYHSDTWNRDYPRVQILTIAELLEGKQIDMPPIQQVNKTFSVLQSKKRKPASR